MCGGLGICREGTVRVLSPDGQQLDERRHVSIGSLREVLQTIVSSNPQAIFKFVEMVRDQGPVESTIKLDRAGLVKWGNE